MLFFIGNVSADNCSSLIQHGLYNEIRKSSAVDSYQEVVNNICRDYSSYKSDKKSGKVKATYGAFGGKAGFSASTYEQLSQSMCSESGSIDKLAKNNDVLEKIISPDAIDAYKTCQSLNAKGLKVDTNISPRGDHISVSLHYAVVGTNGNEIQIQQPYITDPEQFECGGSLKPNTKLPVNTNVEYHCKRKVSGKDSDIFEYKGRRMYANSATLTIPTSVTSIYREIPAVYAEQVPSPLKGAVVAFESGKCPTGWTEYKKAQGRFIRGLDKKNSIDPDKNRGIGSVQEDAFQGHAHSIESVTSKGHGPNNQHPHGYQNGGYGLAVGRTNAPISQDKYGSERVSTETRPKNVALLYCIKS